MWDAEHGAKLSSVRVQEMSRSHSQSNKLESDLLGPPLLNLCDSGSTCWLLSHSHHYSCCLDEPVPLSVSTSPPPTYPLLQLLLEWHGTEVGSAPGTLQTALGPWRRGHDLKGRDLTIGNGLAGCWAAWEPLGSG